VREQSHCEFPKQYWAHFHLRDLASERSLQEELLLASRKPRGPSSFPNPCHHQGRFLEGLEHLLAVARLLVVMVEVASVVVAMVVVLLEDR
jgi:hypothetical protein